MGGLKNSLDPQIITVNNVMSHSGQHCLLLRGGQKEIVTYDTYYLPTFILLSWTENSLGQE